MMTWFFLWQLFRTNLPWPTRNSKLIRKPLHLWPIQPYLLWSCCQRKVQIRCSRKLPRRRERALQRENLTRSSHHLLQRRNQSKVLLRTPNRVLKRKILDRAPRRKSSNRAVRRCRVKKIELPSYSQRNSNNRKPTDCLIQLFSRWLA